MPHTHDKKPKGARPPVDAQKPPASVKGKGPKGLAVASSSAGGFAEQSAALVPPGPAPLPKGIKPPGAAPLPKGIKPPAAPGPSQLPSGIKPPGPAPLPVGIKPPAPVAGPSQAPPGPVPAPPGLGPSQAASSSQQAGPDRAQQLLEARNANYTHVDVSTATMRLGNRGADFDGSTAAEHAETKARLEALKGGPVDDREVRFEMMKGRVEAASARRDEGGGAETMGVFTAPEWALGKDLGREDVEWYREQFAGLSMQHPHMAIMPGTMLWKERVKKQHGLGEKTKLHNTGDVYHAGQLVHSVNKRGESGDKMGVDAHQPGGPVDEDRAKKWYEHGREDAQGSSLLNIGGINMSYEICVDSEQVRARDELAATGGAPVDLAAVISTGQSLNPAQLPLRAGGIGVNSDGDKGWGDLRTAQTGWDGQKRSAIKTSPASLKAPPRKPEDFDPRYPHEHQGRHRLRG